MSKITVEPITDQAVWDEFLTKHPESNFLQSWQWGDFHHSLGKRVFREGFYEAGGLAGVMLSIVEPARRGRYLTVPGGPIIDWHLKPLAREFAAVATAQAKSEHCVFVRARPQLTESDSAIKLFRSLGFRDAPTYLHAELTHQLDLTKTEEELRAALRKGTRYELKKAEKEGISVTSSTDPADIKPFYDMQIATAKRQHFVPFSLEFLQKQFEVFVRAGHALLYTAKFEGEILAQAFIIFYGQEAVYHYGASTEAGRKHPGAYLIQWEAIREAQQRGLTRYNFWGVAPPDEPHHRFAGVSIFKRGFAGEDVQYLHAQDLVVNRPRYLANLVIEDVRSKLRRV
jgi:lipid II:glycine glycyltransferase (peptidoglycan interpeptide bridge formation enzyme)